MSYQLNKNYSELGQELRVVFVETLEALMEEQPFVVALEADLGGASGFTKIAKSHPEQFVQCGIAEANMIGVAAGISLLGYRPFIHTFAPFATRRVFDQLYLSGAYAKTTLNIYGSDPGVSVAGNGGTHTSFEDIALMRTIPEAIVCDVADATQLAYVIKAFSTLSGIHYVRGSRKAIHQIYQTDSTFELGKANCLMEGDDVLIISCGQLLKDALDCAMALQQKGIGCTILDMFTIKPIDQEAILKHSIGKKAIVTFENHSIIGGLGSSVAEIIAEQGIHSKFKRIGVNDRFGQVGSQDYLKEAFGLTAEHLLEEIVQLLSK